MLESRATEVPPELSIRLKVVVIVCLVLGGVTLLSLLAARTMLLDSYLALEEDQVKADLERARGALDVRLASLRSLVTDWAAWDATYAFMVEQGQAYRDEN